MRGTLHTTGGAEGGAGDLPGARHGRQLGLGVQSVKQGEGLEDRNRPVGGWGDGGGGGAADLAGRESIRL